LTDHVLIVVWEGVDSSGKTSLKNKAAEILSKKGFEVGHYKTPSDTFSGSLAKTYGNSAKVDALTRMLLFLANTTDDSKIMKRKIVEKNLDFFFIDRYYLCSLVYGLALTRRTRPDLAEHEDLETLVEMVERLGQDVVVKPDRYVIVDVDEATRSRWVERKLEKQRMADLTYESDPRLQDEIRGLYRFFREKHSEEVIWVTNREGMLDPISRGIAEQLLNVRKSSVLG